LVGSGNSSIKRLLDLWVRRSCGACITHLASLYCAVVSGRIRPERRACDAPAIWQVHFMRRDSRAAGFGWLSGVSVLTVGSWVWLLRVSGVRSDLRTDFCFDQIWW